jgi:hypothetical protein
MPLLDEPQGALRRRGRLLNDVCGHAPGLPLLAHQRFKTGKAILIGFDGGGRRLANAEAEQQVERHC